MKVTSAMMDRQLRRRGELMRRLFSERSPEQLRTQPRWRTALEKAVLGRRPADLRVSQESVQRADGSRLRLAVYSPLEPQSGALGLLWIHGGGYSGGSPEQDTGIYRQLVAQSDCVLVAPQYRLSGEAPYPAALDDCYAALEWLRDNAARLGVRDDRIAVAGSSAGGGLTAALTLYARDHGDVAIAFQMPIYPMIDDRAQTESARENDAPVWDAATNRSAWQLYLGERYGTADVPPYAAAARATDHRGLPPTFTFVGDLEPFRDETIEYVENLRAAGVPVEFELYPGCYHAFDRFAPNAEVSLRATQALNRWFRHAAATLTATQPERTSG